MQNLKNQTVVITGASRGIGAETARLFASRGANVVLLARGEAEIAELAGDIGDNALAIPCDVSRYWEVAAAMDAAVEVFGTLDILINNAAVIEPISRMAESDPEGWGHVIDINLKGVYFGMRAALPIMQAAGKGTILTISSGAAHNPLEGWSHYCASKAGVAMLTRAAHLETVDHGLRIMGLSPGTVATQMQREIRASGVNRISKLEWSEHIPADWPARALLWMCDADADEWLGEEISLRDVSIRRRIGLID